MSETSTTVKVVLISLMVFFVIAIGFTIYESYRSVTSNAGETENQGSPEGEGFETSPAEASIIE